ncbi:hypothetical protein AYI70_g1828 [Smittium culicis]|uniref:Uncharacterized protein n=1 Tax=Smittium culicis TaxID=133412 RepID=A0A1R1YAW4_9FUNG|nr:hypothetical protein AYI70_g1828 [Smittium culicis]
MILQPTPLRCSSSSISTGHWFKGAGAGWSRMCPYAFSQCPEGAASGPDTLLEGQPSCLFCRFFGPPSTGG